LATLMISVGRPALSSMSPAAGSISPGIMRESSLRLRAVSGVRGTSG
jgi:hypothetical protein